MPSPKLLPLLAAVLAVVPLASGSGEYTIVDHYDENNFFREFDFFTGPDPTNGFVQYVGAETADTKNLAGYAQGAVYLGVEHKSLAPQGRQSVRVESRTSYTTGLFVADIAHMPSGLTNAESCSLWPAFWTLGKGKWPTHGEINIIEGVNSQTNTSVVLHTGTSCKVSSAGALPATTSFGNDCYGDVGCRQDTQDTSTYGADFNAAGGGVHVLEWTDEAISTWFFPRGHSPNFELAGDGHGAPNPATWGSPHARFVPTGGGCSFADSFQQHSIIINTALCGQWAGRVWPNDATCAAKARTCEEYVNQHPEAFENAYWLINSIKVYQKTGSEPGSEPGSGPGPTPPSTQHRRGGRKGVLFSA